MQGASTMLQSPHKNEIVHRLMKGNGQPVIFPHNR
jgi:hypothetical protein